MTIKSLATTALLASMAFASFELSYLGIKKIYVDNGNGFVGVTYLYLGLALAFFLLLIWLTRVDKKSKV
jgi:hypothetical protein